MAKKAKGSTVDAEYRFPDAPDVRDIDGPINDYFNVWFFGSRPKLKEMNDRIKVQSAREVLQFVIRELLGWTADDALERMTTETIRGMRLAPYQDRIFTGDSEHSVERGDMRYFVSMIFPKDFHYRFDSRKHWLYAREDGEKLSPGVLAMYTDKGKRKDDWVPIFEDFLSRLGGRTSMEEIYLRFSEASEMRKIMQDKEGLKPVLFGNAFYPVQVLEDYLSLVTMEKSRYQRETELYSDEFLYFCALTRSMMDLYLYHPYVETEDGHWVLPRNSDDPTIDSEE